MGWTIGRLAKRHGLSRSTLLHYDAIGLLRASARGGGDYRVYDAADDERLAAICRYRRAGLPLAAIRDLLDGGENSLAAILGRRVEDLDAEIDELTRQRAFALKLLGRAEGLPPAGIPLDKKRWTELLRATGFSEEDMRRWHAAFEHSDPEGHHRFLEFLRIPGEEIAAIRAFSSAPARILNLHRHTERYMDYFLELMRDMPRLAPGGRAHTLRALDLAGPLPEHPRILDIGCGSGSASLVLAERTGGTVTAVDLHQCFLDELEERVRATGLEGRVRPVRGDMAALAFPPGSFDLVWAEGSIYLMGVEAALAAWRPLLAPGGVLVFSEIYWLTDDPPKDARDFFALDCPNMRRVEDDVAALLAARFRPLGGFTLPPEAWTAEYYGPLAERLPGFLKAHGHVPEAHMAAEAMRKEIDLFQAHHAAYGYAFQVARRDG